MQTLHFQIKFSSCICRQGKQRCEQIVVSVDLAIVGFLLNGQIWTQNSLSRASTHKKTRGHPADGKIRLGVACDSKKNGHDEARFIPQTDAQTFKIFKR